MHFRTLKTVSVLLAISILVSALPLFVFADMIPQSIIANGKDGAIEWELTEAGDLTIAGEGSIADYEASQAPWIRYADRILAVTIQDGVTRIGENAFAQLTALTTVTISASVSEIGDGEYYVGDHYSFTEGAFWGCSALQTVIFEEGSALKQLSTYAFARCTALERIMLPKGLESIEEGAFFECTGLKEIVIPASVTSFNGSYLNCLEDYVGAFYGCTALEKVIFSEGNKISTIGPGSFNGCQKLSNFVIPDTVTTVGQNAFKQSNVDKIVIPHGTTKIEDYAFYASGARQIVIPNTVTSIGKNAFMQCDNLESITIPAGVTSIAEGNYNIGNEWDVMVGTYRGSVFFGCDNLRSVVFEDGSKLGRLPAFMFYGCSNLTDIKLPESIESIGAGAFQDCESLREIIIPKSVKQMEGKTVPYFGLFMGAFSGCTSLETVIFEEGSRLESLGQAVFYQCQSLRSVNLPDTVTEIPNNAFYQCHNLSTVKLPENATVIGESAFAGSEFLLFLSIPKSVTTIKGSAFSNCPNLISVMIPESVTSIDKYAFSNCPNLVIYGVPGSYAETYAAENNIPFSEYEDKVLTLHVTTSKGLAINDYTVNWYEKGSDTVLISGNSVRNLEYGKEYEYEILFGESLGTNYVFPELQTFTYTEGMQNIVFTLKEISTVSLIGRVTDAAGNPIPNAKINLKHSYGAIYTKENNINANTEGKFAFDCPVANTAVTVSANGFFSGLQTVLVSDLENGAVQLNFVLNPLPTDRVDLSVEMKQATASDDATVLPVESFDGMIFEIYNRTKGCNLNGFEVQYPSIYFQDGSVSSGDRLVITVSSPNNAFVSTTVNVTLDAQKVGEAMISLVENGSINVNGFYGAQERFVMLFDKDGKIVRSAYVDQFYQSGYLFAGQYTLIALQKSSFMAEFPTLEAFYSTQIADSDYSVSQITVRAGEKTVIDDLLVPVFDESYLYKTVPGSTSVTTNRQYVPAGTYVTIRGEYKIREKYDTSNETLTFYLPDGVTFIDGSLSLDGKRVMYSYQNNVITVKTAQKEGVVRFCVLGTKNQDQTISAFLGFELDGGNLVQPIGSVSFENIVAKLDVPKETGRDSVIVSGMTLPGSQVTIFENDKAVTTVTANAEGTFSVKVPLTDVFYLSYHDIYAVFELADGSETIVTSKHTVLHDQKLYEVDQITMIYGPQRIVLDYTDPNYTTQSYDCWSFGSYCTFQVKFSGGDDTSISDVVVGTVGNSGVERYANCYYDKELDIWLCTIGYDDVDDMPAQIEASYVCDGSVEFVPSVEKIRAEYYAIEEAYEEIADYWEDNVEITDVTVEENYCLFSLTDTQTANDVMKMGLIKHDYDLIDVNDGTYLPWTQGEDTEGMFFKVVQENNYLAIMMVDTNVQEVFSYLIPTKETTVTGGASTFSSLGRANSSPTVGDVLDPILEKELEILREELMSDDFNDMMDFFSALTTIVGDIETVVDYYYVREQPTILQNEFLDFYQEVQKLLTAKCPDGSLKLPRDKVLQLNESLNAAFSGLYDSYHVYYDELDGYRDQVIQDKLIEAATMGVNMYLKWLRSGKQFVNSKNAKYFEYKFNNKWFKEQGWSAKDAAEFRRSIKDMQKYMKRYEGIMEALEKFDTASFDIGEIHSSLNRFHADNMAFLRAMAKKIGSLYSDCKPEEEDPNNPNDPNDPNNPNNPNNPGKPNDPNDPNNPGKPNTSDDPNNPGKPGDPTKPNNPDGDKTKPSHPNDDDKPILPPGNDGKKRSGSGLFSPIRKVYPSIDPSGYVCEAVPSNRLEGVRVEAYYLDYVLDEFGNPTDQKTDVFWDATAYSQANPLYTNAEGRYHWDVPSGRWLVKFIKEGYLPADSKNDPAADEDGYLPVPPPQTQVNIALISTALPKVEKVYAYSNGVRIEFSQYMQIDSVNTKNVSVLINGKTVKGTLKPLNAEASFDDPTIQYASKFMFVSDTPLKDTVSVSVKNVTNYAGNQMKSTYQGKHKVGTMVEKITAASSVELLYSGGALISVQVTPKKEGLKINVKSLYPDIVIPLEDEIYTDKNGKAVVMIQGNLPGVGEIVFGADGSDAMAQTQCLVYQLTENTNRCAKVVANIASYSKVEAGTKLELSCPTEGAVIYYTLDRTCPCQDDNPSRIRYTGPIVLTEDVFIIAYAVKDGMTESHTVGFKYTVAEHTHAAKEKQWKYDESGHWQVCDGCGEKLKKEAHVFDDSNTCTVCGYTLEDNDGISMLTIILSGFAIALTAAIGGWLIVRKKRKVNTSSAE